MTSCSTAGALVGARDDGLASRLWDLLLDGRSSGGRSGRWASVEAAGPPVRRAAAFTNATGGRSSLRWRAEDSLRRRAAASPGRWQGEVGSCSGGGDKKARKAARAAAARTL
jgi:hypothetical protein